MITPAQMKTLYNRHARGHRERIRMAEESERYYQNITDVKRQRPRPTQTELDAQGKLLETGESLLRNADNRISHRWHGLMVEQKASYIATYPPLIDLGSEELNKHLTQALGDDWGREFRHLAVDATNAGVGWLHVWEEDGKRAFGVVDAKQVLPIYTPSLHHRLQAVIRRYESLDEEDRKVIVTEYWDDRECVSFVQQRPGGEYSYNDSAFGMFDFSTGELVQNTHTVTHGLGVVPFIEFPNNAQRKPDLQLMYKDLVDLYDRVASGFANDIEDIQQIIFVLTGYGGQDIPEFLGELRRWKVAKLDGGLEEGSRGNLSTITIDIPVEARKVLLEELRRDILTFGMGVDPDPENIGNVAGVALKHKYGLLELKCGAMEVEFRPGVAQLARLLVPQLPEGTIIGQTWTRNLIQNELEQAQIISSLAGVTSQQTIDENNPLVDDAQTEQKRREEDEARMLAKMQEQETPLYPAPGQPEGE